MHRPVILERVHQPRFGLARLEEAQGLGDRHLEDDDLPLGEGRFRECDACLDNRRSLVRVVTATRATLAKKARIDTAFVYRPSLVGSP